MKLDPSKPLKNTYVTPKVLPPTYAFDMNPDPATSDQDRTWWIYKSDNIPYSPELDTYPVGAIIPNIIVSPFEGDRANVRAKGAWRDGVWTLEVRRVLDTGSQYDVAFTPERPVYISVAAYNV